MTALSILTAARDWLAVGPERWINNPYVLHAVYQSVPKSAVTRRIRSKVIDVLYEATGRVGVLVWQDSLPPGRAGWEQVIAALDKAIEAEKGRGGG